jgi:hypothetical protein
MRANGLLATSILLSSSPKNGKNIGSRKISLPYSATPTTLKYKPINRIKKIYSSIFDKFLKIKIKKTDILDCAAIF